ncbi:MAG: hypothetical protein DMF62_02480 [Acidobacteria bacterium]|nr:MAG: hypothetical protein DMF62_02480 [Acidobacteriota bacterium]
MDTKKSREEVNEQSDSPLDHGGQPRTDDSGWPEGPDGVRRAPRKVADETQNPGITNEEMAAKQFSGELPLKGEELSEEVEEEDEHGNKRKVKRRKK